MEEKIRFRAWGKQSNIMYNCVDLIHYGVESIECYPDEDSLVAEVEDIDFVNAELMQYTGLQDKNGKEVFQKDIVKLHRFVPRDGYEGEEELICLVDYINSSLCYRIIHTVNRTHRSYIGDTIYHIDYIRNNCPSMQIEVIGNIYENPELLEVQNEND